MKNDIYILAAAIVLLCGWLFVGIGGPVLSAVGATLTTMVAITAIALGRREKAQFHDTTWTRVVPVLLVFALLMLGVFLHKVGIL